MPLYWTSEDKEANRPITHRDFPIFEVLVRQASEEFDSFHRALSHDVEWAKDKFANPFPWIVLGGTYLSQAAMIVLGPPPVKALGIAWAVFPFADPMTLSFAYAIS